MSIARAFLPRADLPALLALTLVAGCGGGSGAPARPIVPVTPVPTNTASASALATPTPTSISTPTSTPLATPTPKGSATPTPGPSATPAGCASGTIGTAGGSLTTAAATGSFTESAAAGQFAANDAITLCYIPQTSLPAPLSVTRKRVDGRLMPHFTQGAGNTYVLALSTTFATAPSGGLSLTGTGGIVPPAIPAGTQLDVAFETGGTWVDVGTAIVGSAGTFASTPPTPALPGIAHAGTYLVYLPAPGTNTAQLDLGFMLTGDDGTAAGTTGLQFVQVEDASGNALPTPATTFFPIANSYDLDGASLTPDASRGAVVDGTSTVYFFSGIPQHTFALAQPLGVGRFGTDGDAIASLPTGDEIVVSVDNDTALIVVSGILAGTPVVADTIPDAAARDGLAISNDGKVMLARGSTGVDVFAITPTAPRTGSTGVGTTSVAFALTKTFASGSASEIAAVDSTEGDGRDGMAISPADSSRGLVTGLDANGDPTIDLLTGLGGPAPVFASLPLALPPASRRVPAGFQRPEPSAHRRPFALTPTGASDVYAVAITPDGTTAYVASDSGIVTVSGVNAGALAQVGSVYAPPIAANGIACPIGRYGMPYSLAILPDGNDLVVDYQCNGLQPGKTNTTQSYGIELTIPIGAGGVLGAPVGQLDQVVVPTNDQIVAH